MRALAAAFLLVVASAEPAAADTLFRMPVDGTPVICAYYDHSGSDWNCGSVRYSGHRGTDFAVAYGTPIAAAADGVVVSTEDGYWDGCDSGNCAGGSTGLGNHVLLEHPDGTRTYYGHMKTWSVAVSEGQEVRCGDVLGEVGSSGLSTGNHVHFQVGTWREEQDPYDGGCSNRGASMWVDQGDYGNGGGCTDGLPAPTCAPDAACGGSMDVLRCEGDVVLSCTGGHDQSRDCAAEGLTCGDDGSGPRCVSPACAASPTGTTCDGAVLRSCRAGLLESERDCAAEGATCDAQTGTCRVATGDPPTQDEDGDLSDDVDPPDPRELGDPGWQADGLPAGGLSAGCRAVPDDAGATAPAWLGLAMLFALSRRRA